MALARLSWTYVVSASHGASDIPYKEALDAIASLVESDPDRYAPLRSWLLAERAYMECMEDRLGEALGDLREAGILWTGHAPVDGAYEAQVVILQASMGGMCRKVGDRSAALEMTTRAIVALEELAAGAEGDSGGGRASPSGALPGGSGGGIPSSFVDLLAGCHYRRAELLRDLGSRLESLQSYRCALDVWRGQFRRAGEPYRLTYAQVLGRVANACANLEKYAEAIAVWEEMRETLHPLVESDPEQYGRVDVGIRDNIATAYRDLGDESRAAAAEAEEKDVGRLRGNVGAWRRGWNAEVARNAEATSRLRTDSWIFGRDHKARGSHDRPFLPHAAKRPMAPPRYAGTPRSKLRQTLLPLRGVPEFRSAGGPKRAGCAEHHRFLQ